MAKPVRLQLSRKKGFNLQQHSQATNGLAAVNVARPSKFGNPFTAKDAREAGFVNATNRWLVSVFDRWLNGSEKHWHGEKCHHALQQIHEQIPTLKGKNLACYCRLDEPCHADILLKLANSPTQGKADD